MKTPRFIQIMGTGMAGTLCYTGPLYGLTADGRVFVWDGREWNELKNKGDVS